MSDLYDQSKFASSGCQKPRVNRLITSQANVALTVEFTRRYGDQGMMFVAVNPGGFLRDLHQRGRKVSEVM